jgi:hypothetical protein
MQTAKKQADQIAAWMNDRFYWSDILAELRRAMILSEADVRKQISEKRPGTEAGIWIESMTTMGNVVATPIAPENADGSAPSSAAVAGSSISLLCRAVNLTSAENPSATSDIAYAVEKQLKSATNYFDPKTTQLTGQITMDDANGTFVFGVTVTLANPLKL